jgi:hypothetical protein
LWLFACFAAVNMHNLHPDGFKFTFISSSSVFLQSIFSNLHIPFLVRRAFARFSTSHHDSPQITTTSLDFSREPQRKRRRLSDATRGAPRLFLSQHGPSPSPPAAEWPRRRSPSSHSCCSKSAHALDYCGRGSAARRPGAVLRCARGRGARIFLKPRLD